MAERSAFHINGQTNDPSLKGLQFKSKSVYTPTMAKTIDFSSPAYCLCFNLQRAARAAARDLDAALKPTGLTSTQFAALAMLNGHGELATAALAEHLGAERTTVTRNLGVLERDGFVSIRAGEDRRERRIALTGRGRQKLRSATPRWQKFQDSLVKTTGRTAASDLLGLLSSVT